MKIISVFIKLLIFQLTSGRQCEFDKILSGEWFQSGRGDQLPVLVNSTHFSNGRCIEIGKANRYLVYFENEKCHKCMVINMKHRNIIQYKESYCAPTSNIIQACHGIPGDATLFTMFRINAKPIKCPFGGPLTFTYSKGYGDCINPVSQVDSCADESRLLFRQQACPDIPKSESKEEELQCLGTWKDGSNRYLAGKINHSHANTAEDQYRCFIYEKPNSRQHRHYITNEPRDNAVWYLSVSADATCEGLFSANEGSKTMKLKKGKHVDKKCKFPSWLSKYQQLHSLDFRQTYFLYHRNTSLKITNGTNTPENLEVRGQTEIRLVCYQYDSYHDPLKHEKHVKKKKHHAHSDVVTIVAHFTQACRSGYKCMRIHRRDNHVVQIQFGQDALTPEEACSSFYWQPLDSLYTTLVTNQEDPVGCGGFGKYHITSKCVDDQRIFNDVNVGCTEFSTLQLHSKCPVDLVENYQCLSQWDVNGTKYIVASPLSRASGGPRRVCFAYKTRDSGDVLFTIHYDKCSADTTDAHMILNATLTGQCVRASSISSGSNSRWQLAIGPQFLIIMYFFITCDFSR